MRRAAVQKRAFLTNHRAKEQEKAEMSSFLQDLLIKRYEGEICRPQYVVSHISEAGAQFSICFHHNSTGQGEEEGSFRSRGVEVKWRVNIETKYLLSTTSIQPNEEKPRDEGDACSMVWEEVLDDSKDMRAEI